MNKTIDIIIKEGKELIYPIEKIYPENVDWEADCFCIYFYKQTVYGGPWMIASWEKEKYIRKSISIGEDTYIFNITIKKKINNLKQKK